MKLRRILDTDDAEPFTSEEYMNLYTYVSKSALTARARRRRARAMIGEGDPKSMTRVMTIYHTVIYTSV